MKDCVHKHVTEFKSQVYHTVEMGMESRVMATVWRSAQNVVGIW